MLRGDAGADGWGSHAGRPVLERASRQKMIRANGTKTSGRELPLRSHAERALNDYFANLNGHRPARLYNMVMREVEEPLFRAVLDYAAGNQSRAAVILGINRGTLRKKLREFGLSE
jgi:Fis family transcriptional regulator